MKNPVAWFEIYVDNVDRAVSFYQQVFAVELNSLFDPSDSDVIMMAFPSDMQANGATGALVKMDDMPAGGNSVLVYFACDDCAVEASRVSDAGGKLLREKMSIGEYGFIALAFDTEGNMIGLHSEQ